MIITPGFETDVMILVTMPAVVYTRATKNPKTSVSSGYIKTWFGTTYV